VKYFGLVMAGLFRRKVRTALTLGSLFVAFLLFGILQAVTYAFSSGVSLDGADRMISTDRFSIINLLPISHIQRLENVKGVSAVTHSTWFGGYYQDKRNFFPKFPVDPERYFELYDEAIISEEAKRAFASTRTGVLVTRDLAEKYEWSVGDRIPIIGDIWRTPDGGPWQFDLVGIFEWPKDSTNGSLMLINYEYFDEVRPGGRGLVGWFISRMDDPANASQTAAAMDLEFRNDLNEIKTATENEFSLAFLKQIGDIGLIVTGILGAVFFTIVIVTGNTMSQAVRERIPELAVLKTLGFTDLAVLVLVLAESLLLCLLGGGAGLALAKLMEPAVASAASGIVPGLSLPGEALLSGVLLAVGLGVIVGLVPAVKAMRISIVDALGGR
jgi:putative ABC transport system permease protein